MRLLLYVRVSTDDQATNGASLAAQEDRLRAWCAALGHEVVGVMGETESGAVAPAERPMLAEVLLALEEKEAEGVAVVALDRLTRSLRDLLDLVDRFRRSRWTLVSLRESIDTNSAVGRMFLKVLGTLAEFERELVGERTKAALEQRRREGKRFSGIAPWGKRFGDSGELVHNATEVRCLDLARAWCGETPRPSRLVMATRLNEAVGTHPRTGLPWTSESVRVLLRGVRVRG